MDSHLATSGEVCFRISIKPGIRLFRSGIKNTNEPSVEASTAALRRLATMRAAPVTARVSVDLISESSCGMTVHRLAD